MRFLPIRKTKVSISTERGWKFSLLLRHENAIFPTCEIPVLTVPRFVWVNFPHVCSYMWVIFAHLGSLKKRFLLIRITNVRRFLAKTEEIFYIFEVWKCDFAESWSPRFKGAKHRMSKFSHVPIYVWASFPHLVRLKMPIREINVSRYIEKSVEIIFIFKALKCNFDQSWNTRFKGTKLRVRKFSECNKIRMSKFSAFWCMKIRFLPFRETNAWGYLSKCDFADSWNPRFLGTNLRVS